MKWDKVTLPKPRSEADLGLKQIGSWNQAYSSRFLWMLISGAGSLRITWFEAYLLKNQSFSSLTVPIFYSYSLRKLVKL